MSFSISSLSFTFLFLILNFNFFSITFQDWLSWLFILWDILIAKIFYLFLNYCNLDILQDLIKEFKLNPVQYNFFSINTFLFRIVRPPRPWCWWFQALIVRPTVQALNYQANWSGLDLSGQLSRSWIIRPIEQALSFRPCFIRPWVVRPFLSGLLSSENYIFVWELYFWVKIIILNDCWVNLC